MNSTTFRTTTAASRSCVELCPDSRKFRTVARVLFVGRGIGNSIDLYSCRRCGRTRLNIDGVAEDDCFWLMGTLLGSLLSDCFACTPPERQYGDSALAAGPAHVLELPNPKLDSFAIAQGSDHSIQNCFKNSLGLLLGNLNHASNLLPEIILGPGLHNTLDSAAGKPSTCLSAPEQNNSWVSST